jgi:hypothetical protein
VVERKRVFDSVSYELEHYNPAYVGAFGGACAVFSASTAHCAEGKNGGER